MGRTGYRGGARKAVGPTLRSWGRFDRRIASQRRLPIARQMGRLPRAPRLYDGARAAGANRGRRRRQHNAWAFASPIPPARWGGIRRPERLIIRIRAPLLAIPPHRADFLPPPEPQRATQPAGIFTIDITRGPHRSRIPFRAWNQRGAALNGRERSLWIAARRGFRLNSQATAERSEAPEAGLGA